MGEATSIGFGGGEVIEVDLPIRSVTDLLEVGLQEHRYVGFNSLTTGERLIVNPLQVKVLQTVPEGEH